MTNLPRLLRAVLAFTVLAAPAISFAQAAAPAAPPAAPATQPAGPQPTPEQREQVNAYNRVDTAAPQQKMSWLNRDGMVSPNFGKPDTGFMRMHGEFMERSMQPAQVLFIGDSITQGWRGNDKGPKGEPSAAELFKENYGDKYQAANFGISGDRTEHVLWRIQEGELDAFKTRQPKVVVVMIGTNNSGRPAEQIAAGTTAVVKAIHEKLPESKILLLSIFPRAATADAPLRKKVADANEILKKLDGAHGGKVKYFELWNQFLTKDGTLTKEMMPDALHPRAIGYKVWVDAMNPVLEEMMK